MRYRVQHVPEEVEAHISGLSGTRARVNGTAQPVVVVRVGRRLVVVIPTTRRRKQKNNKKEEETREEEDKRGGEKIAK